MRTITSLALTAAILAWAAPARAGIAFDDFGPGDAFDQVEGYVAAGGGSFGVLTVAAQFTSAASGELSTIRLALAYLAGTNAFTVSLRADDGGMPGSTVLESFSLADLPAYGHPYAPESVTSVLHPSLVAGSKYWLEVAAADTSTLGTWNFNTTDASGLVSQTGSGTLTGTLPAFAVNVTAVPEPSSLALSGAALACVAASALRRRATAGRIGPLRHRPR
ncbi:hypothetical protein OJF2_35990 [Aquisphaera giovannonii]|uniref:Ice-binding protein C-terminal domain-containing protein n=1 Tax=Aquisphaera giovannonii TaxID=406548 RepID=A0A5B9W469_9BACT|nr:choice-of-anchor R domain-containing protein [Aquisphaera giovannonii]QEH35054.1 hypothetical protein OJF2_35990 [Aquisphaera giovannonii]